MAVEIERKFLVDGDSWKGATPVYFCQGYLNRDKERTVRIRVTDDRGFITIKGISIGASRAEFEYDIPKQDALELIQLCEKPLVEKHRRKIQFEGMVWEVDEFLGENAGLVVAEIELQSEDQEFTKPEWVGAEVTDDPKYFNSNLTANPFNSWDT